ncbi:DUF4242 domain-containing protein [Paenibacillus yanchengensis]|uniref:DUF4242 domain-containing protein n=1 Tax=Paenibacillus yanchengensis TaxID=2035833 RepID=A0ABW4YI08_9BACL
MSLYLVEATFAGNVTTTEQFSHITAALQEQLLEKEVKLLEVQVSKGFERAFYIFEGELATIEAGLNHEAITVELIKQVRLIGKAQEEVTNSEEGLNYLVEWNLPEHLTMDAYLERKKNNSVHYSEVPEVDFSRTYVCEDMTKCLCFYKAPDEAAVKRARAAVQAPIDAITEIWAKE